MFSFINKRKNVMKKVVFVIVGLFLLSGCLNQKIIVDGSERAKTIPNFQGTNHFILVGLGQTTTIDATEICGENGVNAVETKTTFINGLLTSITYGIYAPRDYAIYCKKPTNNYLNGSNNNQHINNNRLK